MQQPNVVTINNNSNKSTQKMSLSLTHTHTLTFILILSDDSRYIKIMNKSKELNDSNRFDGLKPETYYIKEAQNISKNRRSRAKVEFRAKCQSIAMK